MRSTCERCGNKLSGEHGRCEDCGWFSTPWFPAPDLEKIKAQIHEQLQALIDRARAAGGDAVKIEFDPTDREIAMSDAENYSPKT